MTRADAKEILALYRQGTDDPSDPLFAEALAFAAKDAELTAWLEAEQRRIQIISAKLEEAAGPPIGLKNLLLPERAAVNPPTKTFWHISNWLRYGLPVALLITALELFLARSNKPATLTDFRSEMVSFISVAPNLELKTHDLNEVKNWLQTSGGLAPLAIPAHTQSHEPVGCRTLVFRGQKVALVCFLRRGGQLIHFFAINRAAFPHLSLPHGREFAREGDWMTASWTDGDMVCMLAAQGGESELQEYL